jgi:hypothetical protein
LARAIVEDFASYFGFGLLIGQQTVFPMSTETRFHTAVVADALL